MMRGSPTIDWIRPKLPELSVVIGVRCAREMRHARRHTHPRPGARADDAREAPVRCEGAHCGAAEVRRLVADRQIRQVLAIPVTVAEIVIKIVGLRVRTAAAAA